MTTKFTKEQLAGWIEEVKAAAENDELFSISWFKGTEKEPFALVAGWAERFADNSEVDDTFCISASEPKYVMCIKIAENKGPYAYTDYEAMNIPYDEESGYVDDVEIMLEWDDPADYAAEFFMSEWERIMSEYAD